jgi:hypothetical protein
MTRRIGVFEKVMIGTDKLEKFELAYILCSTGLCFGILEGSRAFGPRHHMKTTLRK